MLDVKDLRVAYGAIEAVKGVSFSVEKGEIVTLVGANGAGKTSILRAISGLVPAKTGEILYQGRNLVGVPPHDIVSAGITHVPEGRLVFPNLTVEDNLLLGSYIRKDTAAIAEDMERVFSLFSRLKERRHQEAGTLSGGEQQMLAVGRALMGRGTLMILDEPSMGLAPILVEEVFRTIVEVRKSGMTILLVEQNANMALAIADRGYVLETGRIVLSGKASDLAAMDEVRAAYLGR
ncbi:ABC transporter ATP-binding protein [Aminiphilus circumscriptus]|uniref:ABC transporter ATP-binding protein n=1 Tax=Aminiphilus circumscriptus TaxID=290732 RepID=UPI000478649E|nr:ABC transporter ATP-binding protein [Aminiphilus circumscriptus]